jgi:hypothetical protein
VPPQHASRAPGTTRGWGSVFVGVVVLLGPLAIIFVALGAPPQRIPVAAHLPTTNSSTLPPATTIAPAVTSTTTAPTTTTTPRPPPTTTTAALCYLDPEGNCYQAGESCPESLHDRTVKGASGPLTCENNNGWRWENG